MMVEHPRVAALVLAAGRSVRMGSLNKLLLDYRGCPLVRGVVESVLAARVASVTVVTGHQGDRVADVLAGLPVRRVHNPEYAEGLSTSLKAGLAAVAGQCDAVLVCLGDMPEIRAEHIDRLIDAFDPAAGRAICVPVHAGRRGNPVLWAAEFIPAMGRITGDRGARALLAEFAGRMHEVAMTDPAVLFDIDRPADQPPEALRDHSRPGW